MVQDIAIQAKPGQYLTFRLEAQAYGVPIGTVREINRVTEITPVPQTPSFVAGVMNLRGKVIPVINLRQKVGLPKTDYTKETCVIVIDTDHGQVGMIVDAVNAVIDLGESQIEPPPSLRNEGKLAFVMGIGKQEDRVVILVNIIQALSKENLMEYVDLKSAKQAQAA